MLRPRYLKQRRRLDQVITIERRGDLRNEMNEIEHNWAPVFTTRAAAYPAPGFERSIDTDQNVATAPVTFEVRDETRTRAILPSDRVSWQGQPYNIVAPVEQPERGRNLRIVTAADTAQEA